MVMLFNFLLIMSNYALKNLGGGESLNSIAFDQLKAVLVQTMILLICFQKVAYLE